MVSARVMSLGLLAAALVAVPAYFVGAQPADPKPDAPKDAPQPDGQRGQPGGPGGPGGDGRRGPGGPGGPGGRGVEGGSVKQGMSMMNRAMRNLKSTIGDSTKKDENLKLVNDIQRGCVAAKGLTPDKVMNKEKDAAKKAQIAVDYRKGLLAILEKTIALEKAVMDENTAEAKNLFAEINDMRDKAHDAMGVRD